MLKNLVNKKIQLYPSDTDFKAGIIKDINAFGFLIEIYKADRAADYKVGKEYYISHSKSFIFEIIEE